MTTGKFENAGRNMDERLRDAGQKLEQEVQRFATYINDKVVPEVRQHSREGLRAAAVQLHKLADALEKHTK